MKKYGKLEVSPKFKRIVKGGTAIALATTLFASPVLASEASVVNNRYSATAEVVSILNKQVNTLEPVEITVSRGVNIYYNDQAYNTVDEQGNEVYPFIYNGTTYLPARSISGIFGASIRWDGETNSVYIERGKGEVNIPASEKADTKLYEYKATGVKGVKVYIDGEELIPENVNGETVENYIIAGTTYLPVRAISAAFNAPIAWESKNNAVYLGTHIVKEQPTTYPNLSLEFNQKLATCKEQMVVIKPYTESVQQRRMASMTTYAKIMNLSLEIDSMYDSTQSEEIKKYRDEAQALTIEMSEVLSNINSCVATSFYNNIEYIINEKIPADYASGELTNENTSIYNTYFDYVEFTYYNYDACMQLTSSENLKKYEDKMNELYQKAKNLYSSLNKTLVKA